MKNSQADGIAIQGEKRLFIPKEVVIVDAFKRNILTPIEKMPIASDYCLVSVVAWDIVTSFLEEDKDRFDTSDDLQLTLRLILTTIAENQIMSFNPIFVSNAIVEFSDEKNGDKDYLPYADTLMEYVILALDSFCDDVFLKFEIDDRTKIVNFILGESRKIIRQCESQHSEIFYSLRIRC